MIQINSLTKNFEEVVAVNNLTLEIDKGVTGLVGHNGAGKSTLFRLIASVYKFDKGQILIDGIDSRTAEGKSKVFFLSDNPYTLKSATCQGMLEFYENFFEIRREKFYTLLKKFGLPIDRKVINFSKGMRRQLFIALALSSTCKVLLLDEAFDGLDPLVLESIKEEIIKMSQGDRTIVISSHNVSLLERLCDRFIILHKGKLGKSAETSDIGNSFNKYQALFKCPVTEDELKACGVNVVSFKKVGSLYNFVVLGDLDEEKLQEKFEPTLLEQITMDSSEIIALEMLLARKREEAGYNEF